MDERDMLGQGESKPRGESSKEQQDGCRGKKVKA